MTVANPDRTQVDAVQLPTTRTEYIVSNDPDRVVAFAQEKGRPDPWTELMLEPLFHNDIPGPAKRFQKWTNETAPERLLGPVVLRAREVTESPWRTIDGSEWDAIDDGRRPNG